LFAIRPIVHRPGEGAAAREANGDLLGFDFGGGFGAASEQGNWPSQKAHNQGDRRAVSSKHEWWNAKDGGSPLIPQPLASRVPPAAADLKRSS
jgi:hypothetical protein